MCDLLLFVHKRVRFARKVVIVSGGNNAPGHETAGLIIAIGDEAMGKSPSKVQTKFMQIPSGPS